MTQPMHTEGEWREHNGTVMVGDEVMAMVKMGETWPEKRANARVMAASPQLLAVAERLVYHWNELDIEARRELMMDGRAAIAKAKGAV